MGADSPAENTPNASKNFSPKCLPKPKSSGFLKKALSGCPQSVGPSIAMNIQSENGYMHAVYTKHHNNFNSYKNNENGFLSSNCTGRINYGTIKNGLFSLPTDKFHTCKIQGTVPTNYIKKSRISNPFFFFEELRWTNTNKSYL